MTLCQTLLALLCPLAMIAAGARIIWCGHKRLRDYGDEDDRISAA